ncbi:MAG: tRNA (adenosine(37)-N6)-threonylcarbamoyltransferase complex dimerization subunit type 1 TsaB [Mycoplasmoidaceae bacterium]|nr:tRNA (adenosine(37)-N6)-threonylcarbamoyltransferase complex dimerization subunit type 1 TsaB [Mycoplasmoidaceae bacterium]
MLIDTTNNFCYIGLSNGMKVIKEVKLPVNKNVTDIIADAIFDLLAKAKIKPINVNKLVVNIGPGSFTGDKVGVNVVKAWKIFNSKVEIMTINSLLLQTKQVKPNCISVIDAKSNKLYLAVYKNGKEHVKPKLIAKNELNKYLKKYSSLKLVRNKTDYMYDNFLLHKNNFKKVQDIKYLEPLYLKNPV